MAMRASRMQRGSTPSARLRTAMSKMSEILGQEALNEEEMMLSSFSESSISEYLRMLNEKYDNLKSQLTQEISELKKAQKANDQLKASIAEEIRKRETTSSQTREVIDKLKVENSHLLTEFSSLQGKVNELESELESLESQIQDEEGEIQRNLELEDQVKKQEVENSESESNLMATLSEKRNAIEENVKKLEEMEIVREELERELKPLKVEWGEIAKGLSMIDKKRRDLQEEESKYESNYEKNVNRSKEALSQHSILSKKLDSLLEVESQLTEEISKKNEQLATFREANSKLEKKISTLKDSETNFIKAQERATRLQVEKEIMQNVIANYFKSKLEAGSIADIQEGEREENSNVVKSLEKEFFERKEVIEAQKRNIDALYKELQHLKEIAESEKLQCKELNELYEKKVYEAQINERSQEERENSE